MSPRLQRLQQLLESAPNDSFALFAIAKEHEYLGQPEQALDYYLRLLATDPAYVGLYYHLGKLYEKLERPADALLTYRRGMDVARQAGDLHALGELDGARLELDDPEDDY